MCPQDVTTDGKNGNGIAPVQGAIGLILIGFLLMFYGVYDTRDVEGTHFKVGVAMVFFATCLFAFLVFLRVNALSHLAIPVPGAIRDLLMYGNIRRETPQTMNPESARPRFQPEIDARTASQTWDGVGTGSGTAAPAISAPVTPVPRGATPTPTPGGAAGSTYPQSRAPSPTSAPAPEPWPSEQVYSGPAVGSIRELGERTRTGQPQEYQDVLEEADREFESYIDKLIEE